QGTQRLRGRRGVEQRKRRLAAEPLCRDCMAKGIITASTVPDHIIPLSQNGPDTDDNIRCLCSEHHRIRTAEQFGHRFVFGCDESGRPKDPSHLWNKGEKP
ncbi:HNH endonuclease signature motif containing protein, partial [Brevundimonas sp.]|uniref:HNH endonuclease n=1 Tax=Brevundimonas sp. TaxID=1871086 RepID=UPI0028AB2130